MGDLYQIYSFRTEFKQIFCSQDNKYSISADEAWRKPQVQYLFRYLDELGCQYVIVENDYVDHDFLDDHANYYVRCFRRYKRHCRRAHFFACDLEFLRKGTGLLESLILRADPNEIGNLTSAYKGFSVLKPLPSTVIGRTVLKTWDGDGGLRHFPATRKYKANLFGLELEIQQSLAAQEQDTVLAACATTALWCAFQKVSFLFGTQIPTPGEITKAATKYFLTERPIPSQGLIPQQICGAIKEYGLIPEVYQINADTPLNSLIYSYVAGGIPVVLGYRRPGAEDGHAVTVCGYRLETEPVLPGESTDPFACPKGVGTRISEFYVHDDNLGPFSNLVCIHGDFEDEWTGAPLNPRAFLRSFEISGEEISDTFYPDTIIIPLYHKVRIRYVAVQRTVGVLDAFLKWITETAGDNWGVEWDTRLFEINDLRKFVLQSGLFVNKDALRLISQPMAKYIWLSTARRKGREMFSVITDATDMERSFLIHDFVAHDVDALEVLQSHMSKVDNDLVGAKELALLKGMPSGFVDFVRASFLHVTGT